ncbi:DUF4288 domain-containing protein [Mucilaginibacter psychrotolerans]|uniref:DUF4288 domain-containing protein n=1 Tax=Mucilaginibacter psychrotolerans TaxID=1524096 RepID=A0A4Y8S9Y3_9SPHI|nr:DUF4288 domain-containing protein [Mucilaginibacter psychrotolerans]TFF35367.1 DUF4288 domain-containing protein [Mucilaginibacter psychrotolerans]
MMKKLFNKKEWILDEGVSVKGLLADITVGVKYPEYEQFLSFKPQERIKQIDKFHKEGLKKLVDLKLFDEYTVDETKKRPRWIKTKVPLRVAEVLNKLDFVTVHIKSIDKATKIKKEEAIRDRFFCVKMTVVIRYEGLKVKKEDIEKRFVLVKASSFENAYEILEKSKHDYASPYLNSDGRLVKWEIESFDDCFETDIFNAADFNNPEGVEVYSILKKRKAKNAVVWDGK